MNTDFRAAQKGATAVEYAIVLPVLLMFLLGLIDFGRFLWVQGVLDHAVESAARCAGINTIDCGTAGQVQAYAAGQAYALTIDQSAFSVCDGTTCTVGCVSVSTPYRFIMPWNVTGTTTMTAVGCYPPKTSS